MTHDLSCWKVPNLVKDSDELRSVIAIITQNYAKLKQMYLNLMCGDSYPAVGVNEFHAFCRTTGILDGSLATATVDRMYIAAKVGAPAGISATALIRYEFLEALIRIANAKYRDTGLAESYSGALKMLLGSIH